MTSSLIDFVAFTPPELLEGEKVCEVCRMAKLAAAFYKLNEWQQRKFYLATGLDVEEMCNDCHQGDAP